MRIGLLLASALLAVSCDAPDQTPTAGDMDTAGMDTTDREQSPALQPATAATYIMQASMSDMYEIEAGQLAMQKGSASSTRDFGEMMVNDHTASSRDLTAAIEESNLRVTVPDELDAQHQDMIDRLQREEGEAFDREYLRQQMTAHRRALELHQQFQQTGDDTNLQSYARNVLPVIQQHVNRLEQLGAPETNTGAADMPG